MRRAHHLYFRRRPGYFQDDQLGHSVQRQVAGDFPFIVASGSIFTDLNVMVGYFATSRKSGTFKIRVALLVVRIDR